MVASMQAATWARIDLGSSGSSSRTALTADKN
jgi:hypothetical protein